MKPPFALLVVYGDGVLRLSVPRWIAYGALGLAAAVAVGMAGLSGEYALLRRRSTDIAALRKRIDDQRSLLDSFQTRVAAIRRDLTGWQAAHARMWDVFDPDVPGAGIGGDVAAAVATPVAAGGQPADELELLAECVAEEAPRLHELEGLVSRTGKLLDALPLRWPVRGQIKSAYGLRRSPWNGALEQHDGIDIGSPPGTPIRSPATGEVVAASSYGDYGKHLMVDHGNGVRSLYGHLKKLDVKAGDRVEKGQVIGLVGNTGRSTGPHLHYELLVDGKTVDPRGFLRDR